MTYLSGLVGILSFAGGVWVGYFLGRSAASTWEIRFDSGGGQAAGDGSSVHYDLDGVLSDFVVDDADEDLLLIDDLDDELDVLDTAPGDDSGIVLSLPRSGPVRARDAWLAADRNGEDSNHRNLREQVEQLVREVLAEREQKPLAENDKSRGFEV